MTKTEMETFEKQLGTLDRERMLLLERYLEALLKRSNDSKPAAATDGSETGSEKACT